MVQSLVQIRFSPLKYSIECTVTIAHCSLPVPCASNVEPRPAHDQRSASPAESVATCPRLCTFVASLNQTKPNPSFTALCAVCSARPLLMSYPIMVAGGCRLLKGRRGSSRLLHPPSLFAKSFEPVQPSNCSNRACLFLLFCSFDWLSRSFTLYIPEVFSVKLLSLTPSTLAGSLHNGRAALSD